MALLNDVKCKAVLTQSSHDVTLSICQSLSLLQGNQLGQLALL